MKPQEMTLRYAMANLVAEVQNISMMEAVEKVGKMPYNKMAALRFAPVYGAVYIKYCAMFAEMEQVKMDEFDDLFK